MSDVLSKINQLKRPPILVRAAKEGALRYNRVRCLRRLTGEDVPLKNPQVLEQLLEMEGVCNDQRQTENAQYSVVRHVELLIALIGEAQIYRASQP